jgi:outer membrane receptor for ferrienterochelin and colicins
MAFALPQARAYDGAHGSTGASPGRAWDFTLPTLDGKRFVQASALVGPVLVNFWGRDCPPCVAELPRLEAFAKANPHWTVLLVSTDAPVDASAFVQRHGITLPVLRPGANVIALMRGAGNRNGALPYSAALREGRLCAGHRGEVTDGDLQRIAAGCERPR